MKKLNYLEIIPAVSRIYKTIQHGLKDTKIIVLSGLPGVGKSLYIQFLQDFIQLQNQSFDIIQWDIARKAFETKEIQSKFPMGEGTVHNGLKLIAGKWLIDTVVDWIIDNRDNQKILIIEAPLCGHRFVELAKVQNDEWLEDYLSSQKVKVLVPIPSKKVRQKIEDARAAQVSDNAKVWAGAKPSVMLMLWKHTCEIANEFGHNIDLNTQPPYDPEVYEFVFGKILKHRQFIPLHIDEIYTIPEQSEDALHSTISLKADEETANRYGQFIMELYPETSEIDAIVDDWYLS